MMFRENWLEKRIYSRFIEYNIYVFIYKQNQYGY